MLLSFFPPTNPSALYHVWRKNALFRFGATTSMKMFHNAKFKMGQKKSCEKEAERARDGSEREVE